jgi:hypothetical protein
MPLNEVHYAKTLKKNLNACCWQEQSLIPCQGQHMKPASNAALAPYVLVNHQIKHLLLLLLLLLLLSAVAVSFHHSTLPPAAAAACAPGTAQTAGCTCRPKQQARC